jgi:hypothetical protein
MTSFRTPAVGLCATLLALASLPAQNNTIVSPIAATNTEGNGQNAFPWLPNNSTATSAVNVHRYMQIHSDLGNTPKVITKIAFRRNGPSATQNGTRAIDMELWMGNAVDYARCSWVYANNWVMAPTQVLTRQIVNIGPLAAPGNPAPFEIAIPLGTPHVHVGVWSLGWDAKIHGNVETPPLVTLLDADTSSAAFGLTPPLTGAGCIASGRTSAMSLVLSHHDSGGTYVFGGYVDNAPATAPLFLALGTRMPPSRGCAATSTPTSRWS